MNSHKFQLGQVCQGEGLRFEVINLYPLRVRCLENSGWWSEFNKGCESTHPTWKVGEEYELYLGNPDSGNWNFEGRHGNLPWCSLYERGTVCHYR